jgi:hypothetical protein
MAYTYLNAPDYITFNPTLLMNEEIDQTPAAAEGWFAPAAAFAPNIEGYTVLHEFGHANDGRRGDTLGTPLAQADPDAVTPEAQALYADHKRGADKYGASAPFEMYAEAFAQFYGAQGRPGPTYAAYPRTKAAHMVQTAADYAAKYGWTR